MIGFTRTYHKRGYFDIDLSYTNRIIHRHCQSNQGAQNAVGIPQTVVTSSGPTRPHPPQHRSVSNRLVYLDIEHDHPMFRVQGL